MKELRKLLNGVIPPIDPERIVPNIVSLKGPIKLKELTGAKELRCPDCGRTEGFWNPPWDAWSCASSECLDKWAFASCDLKEGSEFAEYYALNAIPTCGWSELIHQGKRVPIGFDVPEKFNNANLRECQLSQEQKAALFDIAKNPVSFLLMAGSTGTGKTYGACAALDEYSAFGGRSARFINVSDLYLLWKDCSRNYGDDLDLAYKYLNVTLLVLDDLGIRTPTDAFLDFLYVIINNRSNSKCGTIVTTNMTSPQMLEKFGEALHSRICCGKILKIEGKDRRFLKSF